MSSPNQSEGMTTPELQHVSVGLRDKLFEDDRTVRILTPISAIEQESGARFVAGTLRMLEAHGLVDLGAVKELVEGEQ